MTETNIHLMLGSSLFLADMLSQSEGSKVVVINTQPLEPENWDFTPVSCEFFICLVSSLQSCDTQTHTHTY